MEQEYEDVPKASDRKVSCDKFTQSGGSAHFSWSELNGHWAQGNEPKHNPWGHIDPTLPPMLEDLRIRAIDAGLVDHAQGLPLSSGYRCPKGNASIPGAAERSYHMAGVAVDISTRSLWGGLPLEDWKGKYEDLKAHADTLGFKELFEFDEYPDHHLHLSLKEE